MRMKVPFNHWTIRYGLGFVFVAIAIMADVWIKPLIGRTVFFLPLAAIAITSIISGYGPGAFTVFLSTFGLDYFLRGKDHAFSTPSFDFFVRVIVFLPTGFTIAWLGGRLREASDQLQIALDELRRERIFREHLIVGIAHDLRNPLSAAKMTIQLAGRQKTESASWQLSRATSALDRADDLVQDFLDISQAQTGKKIKLQSAKCDVVEVLQEIASEYKVLYPGRTCLETKVDSLEAFLDRRALRRIVENLIGNALKHGDPERVITLALNPVHASTFLLSVHNWGLVIPPELREDLFGFFERRSQSEGQRGWGLGLAVVKELVAAHHGSIEVQSTASDGTFFIVKLPIGAV